MKFSREIFFWKSELETEQVWNKPEVWNELNLNFLTEEPVWIEISRKSKSKVLKGLKHEIEP